MNNQDKKRIRKDVQNMQNMCRVVNEYYEEEFGEHLPCDPFNVIGLLYTTVDGETIDKDNDEYYLQVSYDPLDRILFIELDGERVYEENISHPKFTKWLETEWNVYSWAVGILQMVGRVDSGSTGGGFWATWYKAQKYTYSVPSEYPEELFKERNGDEENCETP